MTGSIFFHRQHSSTAGINIRNKLIRPKLRRCSSVDDHGSFESTTDDIFEMKSFAKCDPTSSDNDSGIEDFDQQMTSVAVELEKNDQIEAIKEFVSAFTSGDDEDLEINSSRTTTQSNLCAENFDENILCRDLERAAQIEHDEKKEFCPDTSYVFHAEFARLISMPISLKYPYLNYYLLPESEFNINPQTLSNFAYVKLDNAKAQFKCQNPHCCRLWTSMRARISFKISYPGECGFVFLKVYAQNCQVCETPAEPLWYMEEACRVMENLAGSMFQQFFSVPNQVEYSQVVESVEQPTQNRRKSHHDSSQRKGNMRARHDRNHCEACFCGFCFI